MPFGSVDITFTPVDSDAGSVFGTGTHEVGSLVMIRALAQEPAGWVFDAWSGTDVGLLSNPDNAVTDFTMPDHNVSFVAHFIQDETQDGTGVSENNIHFRKEIVNIENDTIKELIEARVGDLLIDGDVVSLSGYNFYHTPYAFIEGEPVSINVDFNQGYELREWYASHGDYFFHEGVQVAANSFNMPMVGVDGWKEDDTLQILANIKLVGSRTLTTNRTPYYSGVVYQDGEAPSGGTKEYLIGDDGVPQTTHLSAEAYYGHEFREWTGDIEFIVGGTTTDDEIEVMVADNITITAVFPAIEDVVTVKIQSVGPYTSGSIDSETYTVFEPKQGRDLTVLNPDAEYNNNLTTIVEERDGRFPLGTYTLNNRDFWENLTVNHATRGSQINPKYFEDGNVETAVNRGIIDTPDGPVVLTEWNSAKSIETLPFVKDPLTEVVVPVNEYYDKKLEKDNHELATEGKVFLKFGLRHSGRTPEGNIKIFLGRSIHNQAFKDYIEKDWGFYLTSLDWGDNSKKEFTSEPKLLEEEVTLEHVYNNPGFYTIRGVVFIYRGNRVYHWEKFESNILLNPSKNYDSGIYSHDSSNNFATIGGMSLNSSFAKTLYNLAGYNPITKESKESAVIDDLNEIDQIYLLDMLSKFDSQNISNNYKRIIEAYSSVIYDKNQNILHNGFIDKRFFDSFANASLSDTDMALTKMYKGVKSMWQQLGFENDDSDNPNNDVYWKNIVPKDYTFEDINGISVQDIPDPMEGSKVPRTSYKEIIIDESVEQNWDGGYRWPLLPSIDKFGAFANDTGSHGHLVNQPNKKFFGSKKSWDSDDDAPITNVNEKSENLILNIDFDQKVTDDLIDAVGAFDIQYNIDYEVKLDDDLRIRKSSEDFPDIIEKSRMEQAF
mgnify:CR=1 FL=1